MVNKKREGFCKKTINLGIKEIEILKNLCGFLNLTEGGVVEFLINQYNEVLNPLDKVKATKIKLDMARQNLQFIEKEYEKSSEYLAEYQKWTRKKQDKKPEALVIIGNAISKKYYEDAERLAKTWGRMLGVSPIQLLTDAQKSMEKDEK